jgi:hypothetical protein
MKYEIPLYVATAIVASILVILGISFGMFADLVLPMFILGWSLSHLYWLKINLPEILRKQAIYSASTEDVRVAYSTVPVNVGSTLNAPANSKKSEYIEHPKVSIYERDTSDKPRYWVATADRIEGPFSHVAPAIPQPSNSQIRVEAATLVKAMELVIAQRPDWTKYVHSPGLILFRHI